VLGLMLARSEKSFRVMLRAIRAAATARPSPVA